jgi:hypothetical protein
MLEGVGKVVVTVEQTTTTRAELTRIPSPTHEWTLPQTTSDSFVYGGEKK